MDITSGDVLGEKGRDVSVMEVKVQRAVGNRVEQVAARRGERRTGMRRHCGWETVWVKSGEGESGEMEMVGTAAGG